MKNVLEVVDIVYNHLKDGAFASSLSGGLYKHQLPINNDKEAAVINTLFLNNTQVQKGIVNVNLYVPGLKVQINGVQDNHVDHVRMKYLAWLALAELDEVWDPAGNYNFDVQQHADIKDEIGTFLNIRLKFHAINVK
jgi:hypothetical protein